MLLPGPGSVSARLAEPQLQTKGERAFQQVFPSLPLRCAKSSSRQEALPTSFCKAAKTIPVPFPPQQVRCIPCVLFQRKEVAQTSFYLLFSD